MFEIARIAIAGTDSSLKFNRFVYEKTKKVLRHTAPDLAGAHITKLIRAKVDQKKMLSLANISKTSDFDCGALVRVTSAFSTVES